MAASVGLLAVSISPGLGDLPVHGAGHGRGPHRFRVDPHLVGAAKDVDWQPARASTADHPPDASARIACTNLWWTALDLSRSANGGNTCRICNTSWDWWNPTAPWKAGEYLLLKGLEILPLVLLTVLLFLFLFGSLSAGILGVFAVLLLPMMIIRQVKMWRTALPDKSSQPTAVGGRSDGPDAGIGSHLPRVPGDGGAGEPR